MTERAPFSDLFDPPGHERTIRLAHERGRDLKQREIDRFIAHGIDIRHLAKPWPVAADRVVFHGDLFQFASDAGVSGDAAFTLVVIGVSGFLDVAAWAPATNKLAVWSGDGFALGESQIRRALPAAGLAIHRTPLGWLRAGRRGIVIVRRQFAPQILGSLPALVAEDEQHATDLRSLFAGTAVPNITISVAGANERVSE